MSHLLDIGCGAGLWLLDVAHDYPKLEAVGIDISPMMIEYATTAARSQGLDNARFMNMDAIQPLDFDDDSFDLINARYISIFLPKTTWPCFMRECSRVTVSGGLMRLTEWERPLTNSLAVEQLYTMFTQAQKQRGISFSPTGQCIGIIPVMPHLLRDAGYTDIKSKTYEIDFSSGSENHETGYLHFLVTFQIIQPFFVQMELATQPELEALYQQALLDIMSDNYCSFFTIRTVWGKKP